MDSTKIGNVFQIIIGLIVLFLIYKIMSGLGIIKSRAVKKEDRALTDLRANKFFDPLFYKGKLFKPLGVSRADVYAKDIRHSLKGIGTDNELLYATFGKFFNKMNISEVSELYYNKYGNNMLVDILGDLSKSEVAIFNSIIDSLPND